MNGIHDMGGMHGFGPVEREENEPVFHEKWEGRAFGIAVAMNEDGLYNWREFRDKLVKEIAAAGKTTPKPPTMNSGWRHWKSWQ